MSVLGPGIRTFKPRRSRISARESTALIEQSHLLIGDEPIDPTSVWGPGVPVILEIGFGSGTSTAAMAASDPTTGILAIDVHTPGVGDLLWRLGREHLTNVRVMEADALDVLARLVPQGALAGVRSFFPDPWPKSRHRKRRLVQPAVLELVGSRLAPCGTWHLATDWAPYAASMVEVFAADPRWQGGVVDRPGSRPITPYEGRALRAGRAVTDLIFTHRDDPAAILIR